MSHCPIWANSSVYLLMTFNHIFTNWITKLEFEIFSQFSFLNLRMMWAWLSRSSLIVPTVNGIYIYVFPPINNIFKTRWTIVNNIMDPLDLLDTLWNSTVFSRIHELYAQHKNRIFLFQARYILIQDTRYKLLHPLSILRSI